MTVAEAVTEPEPFVAVKVYVVVAAGETNLVPYNGTVPMLLLMETELAPDTFHRNREECPGVMLAGSDVKLSTTGSPVADLTMTMTEAVAEPELFVAVRVYVVVTVGDTDCVPDNGTVPMP